MKGDLAFSLLWFTSLFMFSMLGIVLYEFPSDVYILGVGRALVICYWFLVRTEAAADAAKKAFLTNRVAISDSFWEY